MREKTKAGWFDFTLMALAVGAFIVSVFFAVQTVRGQTARTFPVGDMASEHYRITDGQITIISE